MSKPKQASHLDLPLSVSSEALLANGSDIEFRELVHDMLAFGSIVQDVRNRLGALIGLSGTQYTILMAIARLSDRFINLGVNELARHLHLSGAFVTIEVNNLVHEGVVSKISNPDDRRRVVLSLTVEGQTKLNLLGQVQQPANDSLFGDLSRTEFLALRKIMGKLAGTGPSTLALINFLAPDCQLPAQAAPRRARKTAASR
jgi:DNA-binding MarR family transcriptional regulator